MATSTEPAPRGRIRVWFGNHPIADYCAEAAMAARYAAAMGRRFPSLNITNEPISEPAEPQQPLG